MEVRVQGPQNSQAAESEAGLVAQVGEHPGRQKDRGGPASEYGAGVSREMPPGLAPAREHREREVSRSPWEAPRLGDAGLRGQRGAGRAQPALISAGHGLINPRRGLPNRVGIMETGRAPGAVGGAGPGGRRSVEGAGGGGSRGPGRGSATPWPFWSRPGGRGGRGRACGALGRGRSGLGRFSPGPRGRLRPRAGGRSDPRCPAASRCPGHDERPPGAAPACGPDPWAVLLRPGRGPRRPRAEEAGKEARRRERGMIHPREPESETPQSGNSLAWADEGSGRTVCPARSCVPH